jgi:hypothetical protein
MLGKVKPKSEKHSALRRPTKLKREPLRDTQHRGCAPQRQGGDRKGRPWSAADVRRHYTSMTLSSISWVPIPTN